MNIKILIICFIIIVNMIGFVVCGIDKWKARKHKWRIPENRFFIISILGGSVGTYLGMLYFRHKTKHWYFMIGIPVIFIIETILILYLI